MADKVGSIMARHNGANKKVGNIYDEKQTELKRYRLIDDTDGVSCLHFAPPDSFIDHCNNTAWTTGSNNYEIFANYSAFEYAYTPLDNSTNTGIRAATPSVFAIGSTDFTIDGYYYINDESLSTGQMIQFYYFGTSLTHSKAAICCACGLTKKSNTQSEFVFTYGRGKSSSGYFAANSGNFLVDNTEIYNRIFHLACVYNSSTSALTTYFDGTAKTTRKLAYNSVFTPAVVAVAGTVDGVGNAAIGLSCSLFRYSAFARWTGDFTPEEAFSNWSIPVGGNIPIRHNNQTYYAPLISDANYKSSPCLAVRHNNKNYYTVK